MKMSITTEKDIETLVRNDEWMMKVLRAAEMLNLPDWWIGGGFLRSKIWDAMAGNPLQKSRDVDLVYFDAHDAQPETDWAYDEQMAAKFPFAEWEIRNQARMHLKNGFEPFSSTRDGMASWVETATAIGVRLEDEKLTFTFCYGLDDLTHMVARPVPIYREQPRMQLFFERIDQKGWHTRWPELRVETQ